MDRAAVHRADRWRVQAAKYTINLMPGEKRGDEEGQGRNGAQGGERAGEGQAFSRGISTGPWAERGQRRCLCLRAPWG